MKQKFIQTLLLILLPTLFTACGSDNNNDPADDISGLTVNTDLKNNEVSAKGGSFFLQIKTDGKWTASSKDSWCTINNKEGNGNASTICSVSANDGDERYTVITVTSNGKSEDVTITQKGGSSEEPDPNPSGYAGRIEIPKLKGGNTNLFITHTTNENGKELITYSLEYDCTQKSSRWVACTFSTSTPDYEYGRVGDFTEDPKIPSQYQTHHSDYTNSGYSRGHLIASNDRQYSKEANKQTFYKSNINPQIQNGFNGGIWESLEKKVAESWGNITNDQDTLYVTKGGTIDNNNIIKYIKTDNTIPVPKYFYMAILSLKNGQYKAIGFWFEHKVYSNNNYASYALTIDELEEKSGIDFFHNLPDNIENEVERSYNKNDWGL